VDTTCRRALSQGYDVTLAADAHATADREQISRAQIVTWHNYALARLTHPDQRITVVPTAAMTW